MAVYAAEQMINGDVIIKAEVVEELRRSRLTSHAEFFNTIRAGVKSPLFDALSTGSSTTHQSHQTP